MPGYRPRGFGALTTVRIGRPSTLISTSRVLICIDLLLRRGARVAEVHDVLPASIGLLLPDRAVLAVAGDGLSVVSGRAGLVGSERVPEIAGSGDLREEGLPSQDEAGSWK